MNNRLDPISIVLVILLVATLVAFFTGVFPYPFGWLIIAGLLLFRLSGREKNRGDR